MIEKCVYQETCEYAKPTEALPCKIGDVVWAFKRVKGNYRIPCAGTVSEMFYVGREMRLCIVVKSISRGEWGKEIFATEDECRKALEATNAEV